MLPRSSILAGLLLLGVTVPALAAVAPVTPNPEAVSIQPKDLPKSYVLLQHLFMDLRELSFSHPVQPAALQKHGFIDAYLNQFVHRGTVGVGVLTSQALAFMKPAGASWDYTRTIKHDAKTLKPVNAPRIGDRSKGFTTSHRGDVTYQIDFQRGPYDMQLTVSGRLGQLSMADAVHWARVMASRAH